VTGGSTSTDTIRRRRTYATRKRHPSAVTSSPRRARRPSFFEGEDSGRGGELVHNDCEVVARPLDPSQDLVEGQRLRDQQRLVHDVSHLQLTAFLVFCDDILDMDGSHELIGTVLPDGKPRVSRLPADLQHIVQWGVRMQSVHRGTRSHHIDRPLPGEVESPGEDLALAGGQRPALPGLLDDDGQLLRGVHHPDLRAGTYAEETKDEVRPFVEQPDDGAEGEGEGEQRRGHPQRRLLR
jgi:hypothetical protein